ncbi:cytochrome P450 oxidoreductase [Astrocystis sublimbata]|nr:cytochrome P450 oxidoreductase [Astrocystis sublimbata]
MKSTLLVSNSKWNSYSVIYSFTVRIFASMAPQAGLTIVLSYPFASLVVVILTYVVGWIIYSRNFHPLSKVPGPWLASVSRVWYMRQIATGETEKVLRRLHEEYGPIIRTSPNEVTCASPEAIKIIYRTQKPLNKTEFYTPWNTQSFSSHRDAFTEINDKRHGERRRIVNHVYSLANILKSEKYIDLCSEIFVNRMESFAASQQAVELGEWFQMYAFDVIGELYFGRMFGFMEKSHDHENWIKSLDLLMPFLCMTSVAPSYIRPLILTSALAIPGSIKALKAIDTIGSAAREVTAKRLDTSDIPEDERRADVLQQLYDIHEEKGSKVDFKMGDIEQEAYVALLAGSDTTAIAFRSVFYHLMKYPEVYAALLEEIDMAVDDGRLHFPATYAEASKLPLLCACIKEALRMHPGVQLHLPRISPPEGLNLCGTFVPSGCTVGVNAAVVHFNQSIFGPDADQYRPSRWLEDKENATNMDRYMLHFGAGTRTCIGKNISIAEIHKLVPEILRKFSFEMWDQDAQWTTHNFWFCKQTGLKVKVTKRKL